MPLVGIGTDSQKLAKTVQKYSHNIGFAQKDRYITLILTMISICSQYSAMAVLAMLLLCSLLVSRKGPLKSE